MTEQEIKQKIDESERQISVAYNNLMSAARDVGAKGYNAAVSSRDSAVQIESGKKAKNTLWPLVISLVGLFMLGAAWFLALLMIGGGIALAYNLNQKADKELSDIQSHYNSMVSVAENQRNNLNAVLNNNTKI